MERNSNVQDVLKKATEIELSGQVFKIQFNLGAFALIEDEYGDIDTLLEKIMKGSAKATIALLWAGLQENHPGITKNEVGSMADLSDMSRIAAAIYGNAGNAIPQPKKSARTNARKN